MPSPLAEALAERLLHHLPPDRAYDRAALEEAATGEAALPRTVRHFIDRMMTRRVEIERERLRVLQQPWLDYEHEEVRHAEEALLAAVHRHVRIPAAAWERVLRHASGCVAAYLVKPVPTLEDFIFGSDAPGARSSSPPTAQKQGATEKQEVLPADVVMRRLGYFAAYPYLREATSAYVEQRDVPSFPRRRLSAFLRRVDEKMCADYDAEGWLRLLQPLFALAEGAYPDHDGLPVELLASFFEEKKADLPLQRLRAARRAHDLDALSRSALAEIIASPVPTAQDTHGAQEPPSPQKEAASPETTTSTPPAKEASEEAPPAPSFPDPGAFPEAGASASGDPAFPPPPSEQAHAHETRAAASEASPPAGAEEAEEEPAQDTRPLWKRFLGVAKPAEPDAPDEKARPGSSSEESSEPGREEGSSSSSGDAKGRDDPRPRWQQFSVVSSDAASEPPPSPASPPERPAPAADEGRPAENLRPLEEDVLGHAADNRALFVRELFSGSREEYERVLRRLQSAENWQTATQIIARDVFRAHQVNIYSDPARSFTDAAETHFR